MDIATTYFNTASKHITLLDAPGHRDFVPNMISGAAQADVAMLVVDVSTGGFEAGFEGDGQTKEHALLVRSLGVAQLVVAINKLDCVDWSKERFDEVVGKLAAFLKQAGFKDKNVWYVPCSGMTGENLIGRVDDACPLYAWYSGGTLIDHIDKLSAPERPVDRPLRLSITDVFRTSHSSRIFVAGKIESGHVHVGDKLMVVPPLNQFVSVDGKRTKKSAIKNLPDYFLVQWSNSRGPSPNGPQQATLSRWG